MRPRLRPPDQRDQLSVVTLPLLSPDRIGDSHIDARLRSEPVLWLGTVSVDGRPHGSDRQVRHGIGRSDRPGVDRHSQPISGRDRPGLV
jgi:hypothetical protein